MSSIKPASAFVAPNLLAVLLLGAITAPLPAARPSGPLVEVGDVARFYRVYRATNGHPTADQLQRDYIHRGSPGLRHLAEIRNVNGNAIAKAMATHPEIFADATNCMAVLPRVHGRVTAALNTLARIYPEAQFPPVTIAISRGKPVAVADSAGVIVGLEALCAVNYLNPNVEDRFVHTVAHDSLMFSKRCARQHSTTIRNPACWTLL